MRAWNPCPSIPWWNFTRPRCGCDPACFKAALDWVAERFPPAEFPQVFEPGIGTGRIAIPLARRGYSVTGIDIAPDMLAVLQARVRQTALPIMWQEGDATRVPYADGSFDPRACLPSLLLHSRMATGRR